MVARINIVANPKDMIESRLRVIKVNKGQGHRLGATTWRHVELQLAFSGL